MKSSCAKSDEINVYESLLPSSSRHPGQPHILMLKDHFSIRGPNGTHQCLVHELMGSSIASLSIYYVPGQVHKEGQRTRFTLPAARTMIYQALLGLDFLHAKKLIHGDFHAGNLLLSLRDSADVSVDDLLQPHNQVSAPVRRPDGTCRDGDPRFLTLVQPMRN